MASSNHWGYLGLPGAALLVVGGLLWWGAGGDDPAPSESGGPEAHAESQAAADPKPVEPTAEDDAVPTSPESTARDTPDASSARAERADSAGQPSAEPEESQEARAPDEPSEAASEAKSRRRASAGTDEMTRQERRTKIKSTIRDAAKEVAPQMKDCYKALLKDFPKASGAIKTKFSLKAKRDGPTVVNVAQIGEGTTIFEEKMHECVLSAVTEIETELPPSTDGVKVTYPFHFETSDEGTGAKE